MFAVNLHYHLVIRELVGIQWVSTELRSLYRPSSGTMALGDINGS